MGVREGVYFDAGVTNVINMPRINGPCEAPNSLPKLCLRLPLEKDSHSLIA